MLKFVYCVTDMGYGLTQYYLIYVGYWVTILGLVGLDKGWTRLSPAHAQPIWLGWIKYPPFFGNFVEKLSVSSWHYLCCLALCCPCGCFSFFLPSLTILILIGYNSGHVLATMRFSGLATSQDHLGLTTVSCTLNFCL